MKDQKKKNKHWKFWEVTVYKIFQCHLEKIIIEKDEQCDAVTAVLSKKTVVNNICLCGEPVSLSWMFPALASSLLGFVFHLTLQHLKPSSDE